MSKDNLGDRMKYGYEEVTRYRLPIRTHTIIRLDGRAFHTFTKGFNKPFDEDLSKTFESTCQHLMEVISGCKIAYTQSDEITLVLTDFDTLHTQPWFDGVVQKIVSVSASETTGIFNSTLVTNLFDSRRLTAEFVNKVATFDSRVFTIPYQEEVVNMLIWRQLDCQRNAIQSVAQSVFNQSELHKVKCRDIPGMLKRVKGIDYESYDERYRNGILLLKDKGTFTFDIKDNREVIREILTPKE